MVERLAEGIGTCPWDDERYWLLQRIEFPVRNSQARTIQQILERVLEFPCGTRFTVQWIADACRISKSSAKRGIHAAEQLGVLAVDRSPRADGSLPAGLFSIVWDVLLLYPRADDSHVK